jgi:hypothetical protein
MSPSDEPQNNRLARLEFKNQIAVAFHRSVSRGGEAWVHWEYSPEEWALFDYIDWRPIRRACFWISISLLFLPVLGFFFYALGGLVAALIAVVIVTFGLLFCFWRIILLGEARKRHLGRQKSAQPHRITISRQGVWVAGTYFPLIDGDRDSDLEEVKMTPKPQVLHFRLTKSSNEYTSDGTWTSWTERLRVLVPHRHEKEAVRLMQRFRTEVINPRKQAQEPVMNPPEPD